MTNSTVSRFKNSSIEGIENIEVDIFSEESVKSTIREFVEHGDVRDKYIDIDGVVNSVYEEYSNLTDENIELEVFFFIKLDEYKDIAFTIDNFPDDVYREFGIEIESDILS